MAKVKKTFRLDEETCSALAALAEAWGVTQADALDRAIRSAGHEPGGLPTKERADADSAAVAALIGQLAVKDAQLAKKDEQIAKLMETVADSTKAVQGAQALHHETAQTLALESAEQKQTRWQRLKRAWKGQA